MGECFSFPNRRDELMGEGGFGRGGSLKMGEVGRRGWEGGRWRWGLFLFLFFDFYMTFEGLGRKSESSGLDSLLVQGRRGKLWGDGGRWVCAGTEVWDGGVGARDKGGISSEDDTHG